MDWIILAILLLCTVQAARRGIVVEAFSLAGAVAGIAIASWNYTRLVPWFSTWVRLPALAEAGAFLLIALLVMVVAGVVGRLIRWSMRTIGLGWADRCMGAGFGLVKGAVLVTLGVMLCWLRFGRVRLRYGAPGWAPTLWRLQRKARSVRLRRLRSKIRFGARLLRERTFLPWQP